MELLAFSDKEKTKPLIEAEKPGCGINATGQVEAFKKNTFLNAQPGHRCKEEERATSGSCSEGLVQHVHHVCPQSRKVNNDLQ